MAACLPYGASPFPEARTLVQATAMHTIILAIAIAMASGIGALLFVLSAGTLRWAPPLAP